MWLVYIIFKLIFSLYEITCNIFAYKKLYKNGYLYLNIDSRSRKSQNLIKLF